MDWVDKPQNYKGLSWNFATFGRLPFQQFSAQNSQTWLDSLSLLGLSKGNARVEISASVFFFFFVQPQFAIL